MKRTLTVLSLLLAGAFAFAQDDTKPLPPAEQAGAAIGWDITGANVDESRIDVTIRVAPGESLQAAADQAKAALERGQAVKIALADGVHRVTEPVMLDFGGASDTAKQAVLVVEGQTPGKTIISGAEVWPTEKWTKVDGTDDLYMADWPHNWGVYPRMGYYNTRETVHRRRELVILNGELMLPAPVEDFELIGGKGGQSRGPAPTVNRYLGYLDPAKELKPGEFGVAEMGPGDTDATLMTPDGEKTFAELFAQGPAGRAADKLFIRLPEGVSIDDATIEVAMADGLLVTNNKSNLVLRNLVLRHSANYINASPGGPMAIGALVLNPGWNIDTVEARDVLMENVSIEHNNGSGFWPNGIENFTLRDCRIHHNGDRGGHFVWITNMIADRLVVTENNWRGAHRGWWSTHAAGGMDGIFRNTVFRDCLFQDNQLGDALRIDHVGDHLMIERCAIVNNGRTGFNVEIGMGPVRVVDSVITGSNLSGVHVNETSNFSIENSVLAFNNMGTTWNAENATSEIAVSVSPGRTRRAFSRQKTAMPESPSQNTRVINSVIVSEGDRSQLVGPFYQHNYLTRWARHYLDWVRDDYTGENNRFAHPQHDKGFDVSPPHRAAGGKAEDEGFVDDSVGQTPEVLTTVDLETWQRMTGSDQSSRWISMDEARRLLEQKLAELEAARQRRP